MRPNRRSMRPSRRRRKRSRRRNKYQAMILEAREAARAGVVAVALNPVDVKLTGALAAEGATAGGDCAGVVVAVGAGVGVARERELVVGQDHGGPRARRRAGRRRGGCGLPGPRARVRILSSHQDSQTR